MCEKREAVSASWKQGEGTCATSGSLLLVIPPVPDPITVVTVKDAITIRRTLCASFSVAKSTVLDVSIVMEATFWNRAPVPTPSSTAFVPLPSGDVTTAPGTVALRMRSLVRSVMNIAAFVASYAASHG